MKHLKLFENFTLTDLEQQYLQAKDLYELGLIDETDLENVEAQFKLERYIHGLDQGDLLLQNSSIQDLGKLRKVRGHLWLHGTPIQSLGELTTVGGNLWLHGTQIQSLGKLTKVDRDLNLEGTQIQSLGELMEVGGDLNLYDTPISKTHTEREIKTMVRVRGLIRL